MAASNEVLPASYIFLCMSRKKGLIWEWRGGWTTPDDSVCFSFCFPPLTDTSEFWVPFHLQQEAPWLAPGHHVSTPHPTPHRGSPHPQIAVNSIETEDRGAKDGIVPYCKHFGLLCFTSWDLYPSTYHTLYPLMIKNGTQAAKLGCLMKRINHEPADVMCKLNNIGQAKNSVKSRGVSKILDQKIFWKNIMANYKFLFVFYYF